MRTIWKGSLVFGQIAIPVGLASAFADSDIRLRNLCREHEQPLSSPRWCNEHNRPLEAEEIVKGFEVAPGQFVLIEDDELEAIAPDAESRAIEIFAFVGADELDPLLPKRTYFLAPAEQALMRPAYGLLSAAMRETETVALARFVAWRAEHVCVVERRAGDDKTLVLRVLRDPAEIVSSHELDALLVGTEPGDDEKELAQELIGNLRRPLGKLDLGDRNRDWLRALIDDKLAGRKIVRANKGAQPAPVVSADLSGALRESLKALRRKKRKPAQAARSKKPTSSRS